MTVLWCALAVLGWIATWMLTARLTFTYRVKRDLHTSDYNGEENTYILMFVGGLCWPVYIPLLGVFLVAVKAGKLLVSNPPESNRDRQMRERREKEAMERKISTLERELGIK